MQLVLKLPVQCAVKVDLGYNLLQPHTRIKGLACGPHKVHDSVCDALHALLQALVGSAGLPTVGNVLPQAFKVRRRWDQEALNACVAQCSTHTRQPSATCVTSTLACAAAQVPADPCPRSSPINSTTTTPTHPPTYHLLSRMCSCVAVRPRS